jgi:hypothetical protein
MGEMRRYRSFGFDNARWTSLRFRQNDIVISTPPKSGTTWMQMMCALLIFQETTFEQPLTRISPWLETNTERLESVLGTIDAQTHRRFIKAHLPLDGLPRDPRVKYICVGRDPRDIAVSWMHHEANVDVKLLMKLCIDTVGREGLDDAPLLRWPPTDPRERFWYWIDQPADASSASCLATTLYHLDTFWAERAEPNIALFHYGDMSRDLDAQMRRLAAFLEIDVPETKWEELVAAASFDSMRARSRDLAPEATQGFVNPDKFFRRGSSGEWRHFLRTEHDEKYYEARVAELADADLAQWVHAGSMA